jgi:hypothetical protein
LLYRKHETRLDLLFFVGGFCFDILLAGEIGEPFAIFQQTVYLLIIATLLHFEVLFRNFVWEPKGLALKVWPYRGLLLHFLLGTLLNIYSIFYIKSASIFNSLLFLILMIGFILANELPVVKKSHVSSKAAMFTVCLFSFTSMMFPFVFGFVGWIPFGLSIATTLWLAYMQYKLLKKKVTSDRVLLLSLLGPAAAVLSCFAGFYFFGLVPPVPLSVPEQGVYHQIEKQEGRYHLYGEHERGSWWQFSEEVFHAAPGDKIYFYAQVFSPSRFADAVFVQWSWRDPVRGWQKLDRIPLSIVGGRREGFRGYTVKSNYQPGEYRVQVQTANEQEVSRMYFNVVAVPPNEGRVFTELQR